MTDSELLWEILLSEQNVVAMVAPSFPIIFNPETIVGQLRQAGFAEVVEVATGARQTNEMLIKKLANNKTLRSVSFGIVRLSFQPISFSKNPQIARMTVFLQNYKICV